MAELNDELFMEYLAPETDHSLPKFTKLIDTLVYLQLPANDPQVLIRFKDIIMDKWKRADHDAVIRFLKSTQYVENKLMDLDLKGLDIKTLQIVIISSNWFGNSRRNSG